MLCGSNLQGDVMSSFLVVLRGDVKLVLPFPPELQAANLTEGVEETLEGQENKHGKKGVGREQRFKSAAKSLQQQIQVLRAFGDFALGEVEWSPVQERKVRKRAFIFIVQHATGESSFSVQSMICVCLTFLRLNYSFVATLSYESL